MTDISQMGRMLAGQAESVCRMLLPSGQKEGQEWRCGSVHGDKGKSFGVHLTGVKSGIWCDFNGGDAGDLIDLWRINRNLTMPETLDQIREYLGLEKPEFQKKPEKSYTRPKKPQCVKVANDVERYLCEERGLPLKGVLTYKVAMQGDRIVYPFLRGGELIMAKTKPLRPDEKGKRRSIPTEKNCEPCLFGWQAIPDDQRDAYIVEGEEDAIAMWSYGYPAFSVPFGGGAGAKQQWIENEFDNLDRFATIYVITDMDEPGDIAANEIMERLGIHRCRRVKLPRKDANQCLVDGITPDEIAECLEKSEYKKLEGLRKAGEFYDEVNELFWPSSGEPIGYTLPFISTHHNIRIRPAEVSLWSGETGHGKSQILAHCCVDWINQGSKICKASLEMKANQTLKRMVKQTTNEDQPNSPMIKNALHWMNDSFLLFDRVGKAGTDEILDVFDYARKRYGCDQFIIDSLMRLGVATDDYNGQEKAVYDVVNWAVERNVHLHLVAHSRKPHQGKSGAGGIDEIKGGMEIGGNAFNAFIIWRNKKKEDELAEAIENNDVYKANDISQLPDAVFNCDKQRNGDWQGKLGLMFNKFSYQYLAKDDNPLGKNYLEFGG